MNNDSNLATNTIPNDLDETTHLAEIKPTEKLIAFAPRAQVPVQLEHWLRKRQIALEASEASGIDVGEIRNSGAKYVLIDWDTYATNEQPGFLRQLRQDLPGVRILIITANGDPRFTQSLTDNGASSVILKRPYVADLALALQAASEGRTFVSGTPNPKDAAQIQITARERQVLELMANGYSNQAIGEKLSISVKTVEAHRARLFKKLGASNVADAVLLAIRVGLVMP